MADINQVVSLTLKVVDNTKVSLNALTTRLKNLETATNQINSNLTGIKTKSIENFVKALQGLSEVDSAKLKTIAGSTRILSSIEVSPDLGKFVENLRNLSKVKSLPSLTGFSKSLTSISGVQSVPAITGLVNNLVKLSSVSTLPSLKGFAQNLSEISKSSNVVPEGLSVIVQQVKEYSKIGKLPNIRNFVTALVELSKLKNLPSLSKFAESLKGFSELGRLPNLRGLVRGLTDISKINNLPPPKTLKGIANALLAFVDVKNLPRMSGFAAGLKSLKQATPLPSPRELSRLAKALHEFTNIGKLPSLTNFKKLPEIIQAISKITVPDFKTLIKQIRNLTTALSELGNRMTFVKGFIRLAEASDRVSKALNRQRQEANQNIMSFERLRKSFIRHARSRAMIELLLGIRNAFISSHEVIVDYSQSLRNLQAIMQVSSKQADMMGLAIKRVAAGTKFSTQEVAEVMQTLGQAGLSSTEAIQSVEAVANLATGTLTEMATSADLITSAMRIYNLAATDSAHISDIFANAINASKLTVDKLRIALNYVGPIARNAGVSLEETSAALMTLANYGLRASTMGTGLRRVLAELVKPSSKMAKAAKEAGVALEELDPTSNSLSDVLTNLSVVIDDTTTAFDLFGKRGAAAALSLTQDVTGNFDVMLDKTNRFGTASDMAATQMEGLGIAFKNLQDKLKLVAVAMGEAGLISLLTLFADAMRDLATAAEYVISNGISPILSALSPLTDAFSQLPSVVQLATLALVTFGIKVAALRSIMSKLVSVGALSAGFGKLSLYFTNAATGAMTLTGVLGGLRGAITGLITAIPHVRALAIAFGLVATTIALGRNTIEQRIKQYEKAKDAYDANVISIKQVIEHVNKLRQEEALSKNVSEEVNKIIGQLIDKYPKYAATLYSAKGSAEQLADALDNLNKRMNTDHLEEAQKGLKAYADQMVEAYKELQNKQVDGKTIFQSDNEYAKQLHTLEQHYKDAVAVVANAVDDVNKLGGEVDWNSLFPKLDITDVDNPINNFAKDVKEIAKSTSQEVLGEFNKLSFSSVAVKWANDLRKGATAFDLFTKEGIEKFEFFHKTAGKISIQALKTDKEIRQQMLKDALVELSQYQEGTVEYFEKQLEIDKRFRQKQASLRAEGESSQDVYTANRLVRLQAGYDAEIRAAEKLAKTKEELKRRTYLIQKKYANLEQKLATDLIPEGSDYAKQLKEQESAYDKHIKEINTKVQQGVLNHEKAEKQKLNLSIERYKKEQQLIAAHIAELSNSDTTSARELETVYIQQQQSLKRGLEASVIAIKSAEADKLLTVEQSAAAQLAATKQFYADSVRLAQENAEKLRKTGFAADSAQYQMALRKAEKAEKERSAAMVRMTADYIEQRLRAQKRIDRLEKQATDEIKRNLKDLENSQGDYAREKERIAKKANSAIENEESNHSRKIGEINKDLVNALSNIWGDYKKSIGEINNDYAKKLEGINANRIATEDATADKLRRIRQRNMTEEQKQADNTRQAYEKIAKARKLIQQAGDEGDSKKLEQGRKLLKQAQDIGSSLDSEAKAIRLITEAGKELDKSFDTEKQVAAIEARKKAQEEYNKAIAKQAQAIFDANQKNALEYDRHVKALDNIKSERTENLKAVEETYRRSIETENDRHTTAMGNIKEEALTQIKALEMYKNLQAQITGIDPEITKGKKPDTDKSFNFDNIKQNLEQTSQQVQQVEANANKAAASMDSMLKITEANGKVWYTNAQQIAQGIVQVNDTAKQEVIGSWQVAAQQSQQQADNINNIVNKSVSDTQGQLEIVWQKIYDEHGNLVKRVAEHPGVFRVEVKEPEGITQVQAGITQYLNTVKTYIGEIQQAVKQGTESSTGLVIIGDEQLQLIDSAKEKLSGLFTGLETSDPKQKLQDMLTVMEGIGAMSAGTFDDMKKQIQQYANKVQGANVKIVEYWEDGLVQISTKTSKVVDDSGKEIQGLAKEIQSNPVELFKGASNKNVIEKLNNIKGVHSHLVGEISKRVPLNIETDKAEQKVKEVDKALESVTKKAAQEQVEVKLEVDGTKDIEDTQKLIQEVDNAVDDTKTVKIKSDGENTIERILNNLAKIVDKKVKIIVEATQALSTLKTIKQALRDIPTKVRTKWEITKVIKKISKHSGGGEVQEYNQGGGVFPRLASRLVQTGSGLKDDVKALLTKGEFVHRVAAVKKYGRKFMEMVNSGLYPLELARKAVMGKVHQFMHGGEVASQINDLSGVQYYNSGGSVGNRINMNTLRRYLQEHLSDNRGINVNNVQFNNIVKGRAVTSPLGVNALKNFTATASEAIQKLATGGGVHAPLRSLTQQQADIDRAYQEQVTAAKKEGQLQIAEALQKEREEIAKINKELIKALEELRKEYNEFVLKRQTQHKETLDNLTKEYNKDKTQQDQSYADDVQDDTKDRNRDIDNYNTNKQKETAQLGQKLSELAQEYNKNRTEKASEVKGKLDTLKESAESVNKAMTSLTLVMPDLKYEPRGKEQPDFKTIQTFLLNRERGIQPYANSSHDKLVKRLTDALDKFKGNAAALQSGVQTKGKTGARRSGLGAAPTLDSYSRFYNINPVGVGIRYAKSLLQSETLKEKTEYTNKIKELDKKFRERTEDYNTKVERRDRDYNQKLAELLEKFNLDKAEENTQYATEMKERKEQYLESVEEEKTRAKERKEEVKQETKDKIREINEKTGASTQDIQRREVSTSLETDAPDKTETEYETRSNIPTDTRPPQKEVSRIKPIQDLNLNGLASQVLNSGLKELRTALNIEELLRKFRIPRFNVGGFVEHIAKSIPGKDSILAALTPGEYVIKAPTVQALGKHALDKLNNLQAAVMPFNTGGLVGDKDISGTSITHKLALTINDKEYAPLQGDPVTISDLLNDLTLAAMRT